MKIAWMSVAVALEAYGWKSRLGAREKMFAKGNVKITARNLRGTSKWKMIELVGGRLRDSYVGTEDEIKILAGESAFKY